MKSKAKVLISLALLITFLFSGIFNSRFSKNIITNNNYIEFNEKNQVQIKQSGFYDLTGSSIFIDDYNLSNNWAYTASNYAWCSGSGTWADPYVIENVIIDGQGSGNCIEIKNSDAYFIIQDCSLYNSGSFNYNAGINLDNVHNGKIINNNCSSNKCNGISFWVSDNNTISGNNASNNNNRGILLSSSNNNTISGNTISNNSNGINLWSGDNNMLSENNVSNNDHDGISLQNSNNNALSGNTANDNLDGIRLYNCFNNTLLGNTANDNYNGIYLDWGCVNNTLSGNNASNSNYRGIYLRYSNNNTISGNSANNNGHGIYLSSSNNNMFSGNSANDNGKGICLDESNNNRLSENNAYNNFYYGISLDNSNNNTLSGNLMYFCRISLSGSLVEMASHYIDITNLVNNKLVYYYVNEIGLGSSHFTNAGQIILINCNNSIISRLNISDGSGIFLGYSNNNTFSGNTISNNSHGITLDSNSTNNKIFLNYFINNNFDAEDNGINNKWDNGTIGNYWDDYYGVDANHDGIGDTPFLISGTAGSHDNFPIWVERDKEIPDLLPIISFGILFTVITILSFIIWDKLKKK